MNHHVFLLPFLSVISYHSALQSLCSSDPDFFWSLNISCITSSEFLCLPSLCLEYSSPRSLTWLAPSHSCLGLNIKSPKGTSLTSKFIVSYYPAFIFSRHLLQSDIILFVCVCNYWLSSWQCYIHENRECYLNHHLILST